MIYKTIFIGNFLTEKIVKERSLPTFNVAGSNRIMRISRALRESDGLNLIVSPGSTLRCRFTGKYYYPARTTKDNKVPVLFCPMVSIKYLSSFFSLFFLLFYIFSLYDKRKFNNIIIYNSSFTYFIISLILKIVLPIKIFQDIEDIPCPSIHYMMKGGIKSTIQDSLEWLSMRLMFLISSGSIIPTSIFSKFLPINAPKLIVTGCMSVPFFDDKRSRSEISKKINILFSGKLEFEHGINQLLESINILNLSTYFSTKIVFHICGFGSQSDWLSSKLSGVSGIEVNFYGFIERKKYYSLLDSVDICIGLQSPDTKFSKTRMPSKIYEYMANGKAIIATNMGDLGQLPSDCIELCDPFTSAELVKLISKLALDRNLINQLSYNAFAFSRDNFSYKEVGLKINKFIDCT